MVVLFRLVFCCLLGGWSLQELATPRVPGRCARAAHQGHHNLHPPHSPGPHPAGFRQCHSSCLLGALHERVGACHQ